MSVKTVDNKRLLAGWTRQLWELPTGRVPMCRRFETISAHSAISSKGRPAAREKSSSGRWCADWLRPSTSPMPSSPSSPT